MGPGDMVLFAVTWGAWRYVPVVILLGIAIALAHRPGDVPLVFKGIQRMIGRTVNQEPKVKPNSVLRRVLAFFATLLAFLICAWG